MPDVARILAILAIASCLHRSSCKDNVKVSRGETYSTTRKTDFIQKYFHCKTEPLFSIQVCLRGGNSEASDTTVEEQFFSETVDTAEDHNDTQADVNTLTVEMNEVLCRLTEGSPSKVRFKLWASKFDVHEFKKMKSRFLKEARHKDLTSNLLSHLLDIRRCRVLICLLK